MNKIWDICIASIVSWRVSQAVYRNTNRIVTMCILTPLTITNKFQRNMLENIQHFNQWKCIWKWSPQNGSHFCFWMDKQFYPILYTGCYNLYMLGFKLKHVSEKGPCCLKLYDATIGAKPIFTMLTAPNILIIAWNSITHMLSPHVPLYRNTNMTF